MYIRVQDGFFLEISSRRLLSPLQVYYVFIKIRKGIFTPGVDFIVNIHLLYGAAGKKATCCPGARHHRHR